jgi:hypothetical protein
VAVQQAEARRAAQIVAAADRNNPGAAALVPGFQYQGDPDAPTLPPAEGLSEKPEDLGEECPGDWTQHYTVPSGCHVVHEAGSSATVIYAIGNSHVQHWIPAFERLAEQRGWTLITFLRPGCFFTAEHPNPQPECREWYETTRALVENRPPDILFTQATYDWIGDGDEAVLTGYEGETRHWTGRGITVVGIRDNPRWPTDRTSCAVEKGADDPSCGLSLGGALGSRESPAAALEQTVPGFGSMDLTDVICPDGHCPPSIGNVWVYRDSNHLTEVYARSALPAFQEAWDRAVARAGGR